MKKLILFVVVATFLNIGISKAQSNSTATKNQTVNNRGTFVDKNNDGKCDNNQNYKSNNPGQNSGNKNKKGVCNYKNNNGNNKCTGQGKRYRNGQGQGSCKKNN
ncbi:MAG: hypothetical protein HXX09_08105 [Bacteroidetes bacterium]|nr:hypothetical protein [Bacteroidota bacterium]